MSKQTVSLRLDSDKVEALDTLGHAMDRDRTYLIAEAVDAYLEVQQWQIEQIKTSMREADAGRLISHDAVKKMAKKWVRR
jgi:predicted transcriptional regulator